MFLIRLQMQRGRNMVVFSKMMIVIDTFLMHRTRKEIAQKAEKYASGKLYF